MFINDIVEEVGCNIKIYADDTKICRTINGEADQLVFQQDIKKLLEWSEVWQLTFHPDKCHVLHLGKTGDTQHQYYMGDRMLATNMLKKIWEFH